MAHTMLTIHVDHPEPAGDTTHWPAYAPRGMSAANSVA
jgi:hypothetical protein